MNPDSSPSPARPRLSRRAVIAWSLVAGAEALAWLVVVVWKATHP